MMRYLPQLRFFAFSLRPCDIITLATETPDAHRKQGFSACPVRHRLT